MLRLLRSWRIDVLKAEQVVLGGRYRVDFLLAGKVVLECDGYAYHSSPEAKAADSRRRNQLAAAGYRVVQTDWIVVERRPVQLLEDLLAVLAAAGVAPPARRQPALAVAAVHPR